MKNFRSQERRRIRKEKENVQNVETDVRYMILVFIVVVYCWRRKSWSKGLGEKKRGFSKSKSLLRTIFKG